MLAIEGKVGLLIALIYFKTYLIDEFPAKKDHCIYFEANVCEILRVLFFDDGKFRVVSS